MKINLTKEQYKNLLKATYISQCVTGLLSDHIKNDEYDDLHKKFEDLDSYLLEMSKDFGLENMTEQWEDKILIKEEVSLQLFEILSDYDDLTLHMELSNKLAWRDFNSTHTQKEKEELAEKNGGYFGVELHALEKKYWDEFNNNEYNNLYLKGDEDIGTT